MDNKSSKLQKRNDGMIEQDRRIIAKLLLEGFHTYEIQEIINGGRPLEQQISRQAIDNDIRILETRWKNSGMIDFNMWKNRLLDELENLKHMYHKELKDSRRNKVTTAIEALADDEAIDEMNVNGGRPGDMAMVKRVQTKEEMREANPAYMAGISAVIAQQCKMLGIDAPSKISFTDPTGENEANGTGAFLKALFDKMEDNNENPLDIKSEAVEEEDESNN